MSAVARAAEAAGWPPHVVPDVRGPARDAARDHAVLIRDLRARRRRAMIISGGETAVTVTRADVRGGRNGEYLLALALALGKDAGVHALAADTDGIDGRATTPALLTRFADLGRPGDARMRRACWRRTAVTSFLPPSTTS
jgi:hydroxypyruvate reductase